MVSDHERYMLLNLIPDIGSMRLRRLLDAFGDLNRVWAAGAQELQQVEGIGPVLAERIIAIRRNETALREELARAKAAGAQIVTLEDDAYPGALRTIPDPPLALYIRGRLVEADQTAVAIVGARHASRYGLECAQRLGYDLALRGVTVVSGLARGIDAAAHRGALNASGRTLAVLGCGLGQVYPPEHEALAEHIVAQGAMISEYPMEMEPLSHNFPRRNRLISGLSLGVVVVEAGPRSGSLITADCALEQGREVFAVPGSIASVTSQGTHHLIKQGARLVASVEDILEELRLPAAPAAPAYPATDVAAGRQAGLTPQGSPQVESSESAVTPRALPAAEARVLACLQSSEPTDIDTIAAQSGLTMPEVSSVLLQMELKRVVQQLPGKRFMKRKSLG